MIFGIGRCFCKCVGVMISSTGITVIDFKHYDRSKYLKLPLKDIIVLVMSLRNALFKY